MINYVDILLLVLIVLSVIRGRNKGFILGMLDLVCWVGSLVLGLQFYPYIVGWLGSEWEWWPEVWNQPIAFLLTTLTASIVLHLAGHLLLRGIPPETHARSANRVLGIAPGFLSGLITTAILSAFLLAIPLPENLQENTRESRVVNHLAGYTESLEARLTPIFNDAFRQTLNNLTINPESDETVQLPFKVAHPKPRPDLEAQMLELLNKERRETGLSPLSADTTLRVVARMHAADMFARGYFSHQTPEGLDPFDRIKEANIKFRSAGENLALAPTLSIAHSGLMESPGHRKNILQPAFGRVGIGILDGGRRGLMITQNFKD
jgi:uncharacterized protein YkwD